MVALRYSAVVPAFDAAATLEACLGALTSAVPAPAEIIVYDDGSTDRTREIALHHGAVVVRGDRAQAGPAVGRNAAARVATSPILVFVDADVVAEPDAPGRLAAALTDGVVASFGAYGDRARVSRLAGRYANLRHHHTHVTAPLEASTFWAGLGAVDAEAFRRVGGFDEQFARPSIEDVELGLRLRREGGIRIVRQARGHHLKNWNLRQLWRTDITRRAVPWSVLMAEGRIPATLNTGASERTKSALALAVLGALLASPFSPVMLLLGAAALAAYLALNGAFLRLLATDSARLLAAGSALHLAYHVYASVVCTAVLVGLGFRARMRRRQRAETAIAAQRRPVRIEASPAEARQPTVA